MEAALAMLSFAKVNLALKFLGQKPLGDHEHILRASRAYTSVLPLWIEGLC